MAVLSDYTSGRISLANGSTTVTGTGTLFNVAKFREGDTLQIQNLTAVIASVNSDTSLTLTAPWTGTTLTNAIYRARFLPDNARVTAQATTLIELLGNGNLQSIAGLTGAADTMPYFTGAGTMGRTDLTATARVLLNLAGTAGANKLPFLDSASSAALTDLSPFARTMLDDTDASQVWTTLGGSFGGTSGSRGWMRFPNGLILQWGRDNLVPNGDYNNETIGGITFYNHYYLPGFPIPFPNALYCVSGSNVGYTFAGQGSMALRTVSIGADGYGADAAKDHFLVIMTAASLGNAPYISWQAYGY